MSVELDRPQVKLYEQTDGVDIYPSGYKEIASVTVDNNAKYSFNLELNNQNTYFIGFRNLDTSIYIPITRFLVLFTTKPSVLTILRPALAIPLTYIVSLKGGCNLDL